MLYFFLFLISSALIYRSAVKAQKTNITKSYLEGKFRHIPDIGIYQESYPVFFGGPQKIKHAVLLLHGYSGAVEEFKQLIFKLKEEGIPFYAPMISGFGLSDMRFLYVVEAKDWMRDAMVSFDLLAELAEEVSVIGHSNGGALAIFIAQKRKVKHLILSAPNIIPQKSDKIYKALLNTPFISSLLRFLVPAFSKPIREGRKTCTDTLDYEHACRCFNYPALPLQSLKALWDTQDRADIAATQSETLSILYGEKDLTVDMQELTQLLENKKITYAKHTFKNSAHNLFEDFEKDGAIKVVMNILKSGAEK